MGEFVRAVVEIFPLKHAEAEHGGGCESRREFGVIAQVAVRSGQDVLVPFLHAVVDTDAPTGSIP